MTVEQEELARTITVHTGSHLEEERCDLPWDNDLRECVYCHIMSAIAIFAKKVVQ